MILTIERMKDFSRRFVLALSLPFLASPSRNTAKASGVRLFPFVARRMYMRTERRRNAALTQIERIGDRSFGNAGCPAKRRPPFSRKAAFGFRTVPTQILWLQIKVVSLRKSVGNECRRIKFHGSQMEELQ